MQKVKKMRRLLLTVVTSLSLLIGPFGLLGASSVSAASDLKPVPKAPAANRIDAPMAAKDKAKADANAITPNIAWTVSLNASSTYLWPTQTSTLTATANADVGPTPYYISIYDFTSHTNVAVCGTGTSCVANVTQPTATTHTYQAYVSYYPSANPPAGLQASSSYVYVTWKSVSISLQANPSTAAIGGNNTLTSTTSEDIGPSPFYAEIFDLTTNTRVGVCGFGTTCSATVSQAAATTHKYVAYVSNYDAANPPAGLQATSNFAFATWSNAGYTVSTTATNSTYGHATVTATANVDVGPTPYYIEIFDLTTNTRVGVCGSGSTCSVDVAVNFGKNDFVSFISSYDTALPPANTQASSNIATDFFFPIP